MTRNRKLIVSFVVLAANLLVLSVLAYMLSVAKDHRETEIDTALENLTLLLNVSMTEAVAKTDLSLRSVADQVEGEARRHGQIDEQTANTLLDHQRMWLAGFASSIRIVNSSGVVLDCSGCVREGEGASASMDGVPDPKNTGDAGLQVSDLLTGRTSDESHITFSRRYNRPDGSYGGVVAASVPVHSFEELFAHIDFGRHGFGTLRDSKLALVVRAPFNAIRYWQIGSKPSSPEVMAVIASGVQQKVFEPQHTIDGFSRKVAYRRLSALPFHLLMSKTKDDYLAGWRSLVRKTIGAAIVFLAGSIMLAWLVWKAREADDHSSQLLRHASDGIHILDLKHNIVKASDAFCLMLGYTSAEMTGMNVSRWSDRPLYLDRLNLLSARTDPSEFVTLETQYLHRNGDTFDVELTIRSLELAGEQVFFCAARDITTRKRTEQALIRSESRFRRLFEENTSVMLVIDPSSGEILNANRAASAYYGYGTGRMAGMHFPQIEASSDERTGFQQTLYERKSFSEAVHKLASGDEREVEVHSAPIETSGKLLLFAIVHDVSQRKKAETRAKRLNNFYAALSQCNQAIVHSVDIQEFFQKICRCVVDYGLVRSAWIGLVDEQSKLINPAARGGGGEAEFSGSVRLTSDPDDPHSRTLSGEAVRSNEPQWCQDFLADPARDFFHEWARSVGCKALASLPLCKLGVPIGCLTISADEINAFDEEVRALLVEMATNISFFLDNSAREADRRHTEEALYRSERRYRLIFQTSLDIIAISRLSDGKYVDVNQAGVNIVGFDRDEAAGQTSLDLNIWVNPEARVDMIDRLRRDLECRNMEVQLRKKDGTLFWGLISASIVDLEGERCVLSIIRDISSLKKATEEISNLGSYDPLTHLANRRLLTGRLEDAIAGLANSKRKAALLFVDLDKFKVHNDRSGHLLGDSMLMEVASRLTAHVTEVDTVSRWGGDEFIVLLAELDDDIEKATHQAAQISEKILTAIALPYFLPDREYSSTASIGITIFGQQEESIVEIQRQADIAMYQAKLEGGNAVRFFSPDLQKAIDARAGLEEDLQRALPKGQLQLYYQAQIADGNLVGAEALIRWAHPERGFMEPNHFIPLAEETGLIIPIGQWVLETGCRQIAAWGLEEDTDHIVLAVNVSAAQFRQPDFVECAITTLKRTGANPERLKLELTESMLVEDIEGLINKMSTLRALGVKFSLDDFGTGYSSLSYLKRLPLDQLKIDRSFVRGVLTDPNDAAICKVVITLSQAMGLSVIAEGVESEEQSDWLAREGCDLYQGFFFGPPLPLEEFQLRFNGVNS